MTGPRASGAPLPTRSRPPAAEADQGRATDLQRHGASNADSASAASADAPQPGATDGDDLDAPEAAHDSDIPEDVELATGPIPTDLFEAVEGPPTPPAAPPAAADGASPARQGSRSADLTGALLGSAASAEDAPDALLDTVAAIEELFPGTLVASRPSEDADPDPGAGTDEAEDEAAGDEPDADEGPRDEDDAGSGGSGVAGLFDVDDGTQAPRDDGAAAGRRTTPDRSEAS